MSENTPTVLVADDNPVLLQGISRALEAGGYVVHAVESGLAVLQYLGRAAERPDLLLLDVMMPGMTGLDVLRRLNAEPEWRGVPVILITAASVDDLPRAALRAGAVDLLTKPFRLADLIGRIDAQVRRARSAVPVAAPAARE